MIYSVVIYYKQEGKIWNINVPEVQIKSFFDDISKGQVWINNDTNEGFWTSFDQVRNISVMPLEVENE